MAKFQKIDEAAFNRVAARAKRLERRHPFAKDVHYDKRGGRLKLKLSTGMELSFDPRAAYGLENATDDDLAGVQVEGAGGAIYFPGLDADFSVARLIEGFLGPTDWGRQERRAAASRENGKLGGRPKDEAKNNEKIKINA